MQFYQSPLANLMPTSAIQAANKVLCATLLESPSVTKRTDGTEVLLQLVLYTW